MKIKALACVVCKKDIVLGQMAVKVVLDDGTVLVPVHRPCTRKIEEVSNEGH